MQVLHEPVGRRLGWLDVGWPIDGVGSGGQEQRSGGRLLAQRSAGGGTSSNASSNASISSSRYLSLEAVQQAVGSQGMLLHTAGAVCDACLMMQPWHACPAGAASSQLG